MRRSHPGLQTFRMLCSRKDGPHIDRAVLDTQPAKKLDVDIKGFVIHLEHYGINMSFDLFSFFWVHVLLYLLGGLTSTLFSNIFPGFQHRATNPAYSASGERVQWCVSF